MEEQITIKLTPIELNHIVAAIGSCPYSNAIETIAEMGGTGLENENDYYKLYERLGNMSGLQYYF